jgi:hypothetical protein
MGCIMAWGNLGCDLLFVMGGQARPTPRCIGCYGMLKNLFAVVSATEPEPISHPA